MDQTWAPENALLSWRKASDVCCESSNIQIPMIPSNPVVNQDPRSQAVQLSPNPPGNIIISPVVKISCQELAALIVAQEGIQVDVCRVSKRSLKTTNQWLIGTAFSWSSWVCLYVDIDVDLDLFR